MNMTENFPDDGAVTREELHFRRIDMRGWRRSDGLYEVEGRVIDQKPQVYKSPNGFKVVPPGEPIHDMGVKLVFDEDMLVHSVSAFTASAPFDDCFAAGKSLQTIKGLRIAGGWSSEVRRRLGGAQSCTHLIGILIPMGTVAYQSLTKVRYSRPQKVNFEGVPVKVDSCYAYAANRELVMRKWPGSYTGPIVNTTEK